MENLDHIINEHIKFVVQKYHYNIGKCCEKLGCSTFYLRKKMIELGMLQKRKDKAIRFDTVHLRNTPNNGFSETFCKQRAMGMRKNVLKFTNSESEVTCRRCLAKMSVTTNTRAQNEES